MLDIKNFIRKLPQPSQGHYYERREAYLTPRFTPARVYTRASHHLPGTEHGDEPPCTWLRRLRSECTGSHKRNQGNKGPHQFGRPPIRAAVILKYRNAV